MKNTEDIFDVVNERDEVIDRLPRSIVHAKGLFHRASHVWIFNMAEEILLQRRSPTKDRYPNVWTSSVSGHVDSGEDYLQAAKREIVEEIGLVEQIELKEIAYESAHEDTELEFVKLYIAQSEGPFQFPEDEVSELRWVTRKWFDDELEKAPQEFAPSFQYLWKKYRDKI